jgi:hypothetical protein
LSAKPDFIFKRLSGYNGERLIFEIGKAIKATTTNL